METNLLRLNSICGGDDSRIMKVDKKIGKYDA